MTDQLKQAAQATPEPLHLFEFWWESHMPQATQSQAWAAWIDAQNSKGATIDAAQPATPPQQAAGEPVGDGFVAFKAKCDEVFGWVVGLGGYEDAVREAWKAAHPAPAVPEDVQRDADRYRWLREQDWFSGPLCVLREPKRVLTRGIGLGADCPSGDRLDAAIDAMLAAAQAKGGEQ